MSIALLVILIVVGLLLLAGVGFALLRSRRTVEPAPRVQDHIEPSAEAGAVSDASEAAGSTAVLEREAEVEPEPEPPKKPSFRDRLSKARGTVSGYFGSVLGRSVIDDDTWEELEEALISADVGVPTTMAMLDRVKDRVKAESIKEPAEMMEVLKAEMIAEASGFDISLQGDGSPAIWMFVGVNGVGKTTTIGKLAKREVEGGRSVVLGAGDTFRAAAAEQLETWAVRAEAGFIRGAEGADPSSVIFDAVEHASSRNADLVMADTAGRLHNKTNLMEELRKLKRVAGKGDGQVTEVLLVIDATTGQNGLVQAKVFTEAVDVTGVVLTKLDGSAKGGIVLAIQSELGIPVKLVGLGEGIADLVEFDPNEFVDALFA